MSFVIYDTTKSIFDINVSTILDNIDDDVILYGRTQNLSYFKDINLAHDVTIYANDGDCVHIKELGIYGSRQNNRFIKHIRSKQPDVLICSDESKLPDSIKAPLVIRIGNNNFSANSECTSIKVDEYCHCSKCCRCEDGFEHCVQKCKSLESNRHCRNCCTCKDGFENCVWNHIDPESDHPCYENGVDETQTYVSLSGECYEMIDDVYSAKLIKLVTNYINKYMDENTPITKSVFGSTPFLSIKQKERLYEAHKEWMNGYYSYGGGCYHDIKPEFRNKK